MDINRTKTHLPLEKAESITHDEGTLSVLCDRPFDDVAARLEGSIAANDLAILQVYDFDRLVEPGGLGPTPRCRIYEVFHVGLAARLLALDLQLAHLLPSRILMHERDGMTKVSVPVSSDLMSGYSLAVDAIVFLVSAALSFLSMRSRRMGATCKLWNGAASRCGCCGARTRWCARCSSPTGTWPTRFPGVPSSRRPAATRPGRSGRTSSSQLACARISVAFQR